MKRLFAIIVTLLAIFTATAQEEHSIVLDQSSFRAVQKDALTGANIDPIAKDTSRNPCARVKIRFANMTRADVDALDVKFQSNTDLARQEVAQYFDNVLIIEITAKPNTRFYIQSPDFGQSNEVTLNLEGDKEYEMEARLNQTYSIVVNSNFEGAAVYIDGQYKGVTNNNFQLTVKDVPPGDHMLKVVYGGAQPEQKINVHRSSISFRQNINIAAAKPQHVVFKVTPVDAVVEIDGVHLYGTVDNNGYIERRLKSGSYDYTVTAPNYHPYKGTIVVRDTKVTEEVNLLSAFGQLQIAGEGLADASIYINNRYIGKMPIETQQLASGEYSVRVIKPRYKPYEGKVVVVDVQTTMLTPTLEPNFAKVTLRAATSETEIWLNDSFVSKGIYITDLEVGSHSVEGRLAGHSSLPKIFDIESTEAQTIDIPAAVPMYGLLDVSSTPMPATIIVDGKDTGKQTPDTVENLLVGEHTVTVLKTGYKPYIQKVNILENQITEISVRLTYDGTTPAPKPQLQPQPQKQPKEPKQPKEKPQAAPAKVKNGYQSNVELGYSMHAVSASIINRVGVSYIGGYRANRIFIGLGVGAELNFDSIVNNERIANAKDEYDGKTGGRTAMSSGLLTVPVFAHMRAYMGRRSRSFVYLSAGGKLLGTDSFTYEKQTFKYNSNGFFADLGAGVQLRKFFISAAVSAQTSPWAEFVSNTQIDLKSKLAIGAKVSMGFTF